MESISGKLKETIMNSMEKERTYKNSAIKELIYRKTGMEYGKDYQESHFAGIINSLYKKGILEKVGRGEYKIKKECKNSDGIICQEMEEHEEIYVENIKDDIEASVRRELTYLKKITENMQIAFDTADKADIQNAYKIKELIEYLEQFNLF